MTVGSVSYTGSRLFGVVRVTSVGFVSGVFVMSPPVEARRCRLQIFAVHELLDMVLVCFRENAWLALEARAIPYTTDSTG
jgi:hypothetical protein